MWSPRQRAVLAVVTLALSGLLALQLLHRPQHIDRDPPEKAILDSQLQSRLDPNVIDAESFAALPGIGPGLADRIVAYREQFHREQPGQVAFRTLKDLENVKGIGPAIAQKLEPYLIFPSEE